ncbi:MAG: DUF4149 domain-containing protein [Candidatus Dadabacteria bacterium]|nr:DUF4149 domain-containing protein [Candidatus Dadabacteria bacterium]NIS09804.1 DUF4149 domain-containing protein [Candidatus Dadabacteria bacterium]NIY22865.1 DUF4149 domain-containing protein [Candidatus Dadabacteria bacterium]
MFLISMGFWLGSIFFFSSVTAPSIFGTLPKPEAGVLISVIFNKYYILQYILAVIAVASMLLLIFFDKEKENKFRVIRIGLISSMFLMTLLSGTYIRNSALDAKSVMKNSEPGSEIYIQSEKVFKSSHRNSVIVNGLVFLVGIVILFNIARREEI